MRLDGPDNHHHHLQGICVDIDPKTLFSLKPFWQNKYNDWKFFPTEKIKLLFALILLVISQIGDFKF